MIKDEIISIFSRDYIKSYLGRNRNLIILAVVILCISIIIGYVYNGIFRDLMIDALKNMNIPMDSPWNATLALFSNNMRVNLLIVLLGLTFSIISVMVLFVNGVVIGFVGSIVPVEVLLLYTVPHGIFEIPALILAVAGSFIVTKFEVKLLKGIFQNGKTFKGELYSSGILLKDILLTVVLDFVLLVIAAVIEANFTVAIGDFIIALL